MMNNLNIIDFEFIIFFFNNSDYPNNVTTIKNSRVKCSGLLTSLVTKTYWVSFLKESKNVWQKNFIIKATTCEPNFHWCLQCSEAKTCGLSCLNIVRSCSAEMGVGKQMENELALILNKCKTKLFLFFGMFMLLRQK